MRKSSLVPVFACVFELRKPLRRLPVILNLSKIQVFHTVTVCYCTIGKRVMISRWSSTGALKRRGSVNSLRFWRIFWNSVCVFADLHMLAHGTGSQPSADLDACLHHHKGGQGSCIAVETSTKLLWFITAYYCMMLYNYICTLHYNKYKALSYSQFNSHIMILKSHTLLWVRQCRSTPTLPFSWTSRHSDQCTRQPWRPRRNACAYFIIFLRFSKVLQAWFRWSNCNYIVASSFNKAVI